MVPKIVMNVKRSMMRAIGFIGVENGGMWIENHNDEKVIVADIYSEDVEKCLSVVDSILAVWDLSNG